MKKVISLLAMMFVFTNVNSQTQNVCFYKPLGGSVGSSTLTSVCSADFNGDGFLDLALAKKGGSNNVVIDLETGGGNSLGTNFFTVGYNPNSIISADFNNDGKADLATADYGTNTVSVLLNVNTSTVYAAFTTSTNFTVGNNPYQVISTDFNNDGFKDLATINGTSSGSVSILLGNGTGTFGSAINFSVSPYPQSICSADFNNDSKADLAIICQSYNGTVSVVLGTGTGSFGAATSFTVGNEPMTVISTDFNGDGKADLATANNSSNDVSVLLGMGTGNFNAATSFTVGFSGGTEPYGICTADFNGDGKLDLATADPNTGTSVSVLLGNGAGSFGDTLLYLSGGGSNYSELLSVDFNNDGKPDLIAVDNTVSYGVYPFLNCSTSTTGLNQFPDNSTHITVYPNPNNGSFIIETNSTTNQTIQVYDINGKMVLCQIVNGKATIDASNLNEGVYNISITGEEGLVNKRLVIVR